MDEPRSTTEFRPDMIVYGVHGGRACLRIATAVGPDLVLIDSRCPRGLEDRLRSHPTSASAGLVRMPAGRFANHAGGTSLASTRW